MPAGKLIQLMISDEDSSSKPPDVQNGVLQPSHDPCEPATSTNQTRQTPRLWQQKYRHLLGRLPTVGPGRQVESRRRDLVEARKSVECDISVVDGHDTDTTLGRGFGKLIRLAHRTGEKVNTDDVLYLHRAVCDQVAVANP